MWSALFPNWKRFKVYLTESNLEKGFLNQLTVTPFEIKILKECPSHLIFVLKPLNISFPPLFLKAFIPKIFKKNRIKRYLDILRTLKSLKIPTIDPILLFWENPLKAFIRREKFYGGILFYYVEKGFLTKDIFFSSNLDNILKKLVSFIFSIHQKKVLLKDTKYNNFFYEEEDKFKLFDLDGIKILRKPPSKVERLKDLSTLSMSLEWVEISQAREKIFSFYKDLYPTLTKEDFEIFSNFVERKKAKRIKHLLRN